MKKVTLSIAAVFIFTVLASATEPANVEFTAELKISSFYVGDYNTTYGWVKICCNDTKIYSFPLGNDLGKTMYTTALAAFTSGKKVMFLKANGDASADIRVYRIVIY